MSRYNQGLGGSIWRFNNVNFSKEWTLEFEVKWFGTINNFYYTLFYVKHNNGNLLLLISPQSPITLHYVGIYDNNQNRLTYVYEGINLDTEIFRKYTITWDGRYLKYYINGVLYATEDAGSEYDLSGSKVIYINGGISGNGIGEVSNIKSIKIYNRVLSDDEIKENVDSWDNPIHKDDMVFWIDADDWDYGVWKDRISGIEGSYVGSDRIVGYEVVDNKSWIGDSEFDGALKGYYFMSEDLSDKLKGKNEYTLEADNLFEMSLMGYDSIASYNYPIYLYLYDSNGVMRYRIGFERNYSYVGYNLYSVYITKYDESGNYVSNLFNSWSKLNVKFGCGIAEKFQLRAGEDGLDFWLNGKKLVSGVPSEWIDWSIIESVKVYIQNPVLYVGNVRIYDRRLSDDELRSNLDNWDNPIQNGLVEWVKPNVSYVRDVDNLFDGHSDVLNAKVGVGGSINPYGVYKVHQDSNGNKWVHVDVYYVQKKSRIGVISDE